MYLVLKQQIKQLSKIRLPQNQTLMPCREEFS